MNFCTNCGAKLTTGDKFCTNCGQPVTVQKVAEEDIADNVESAENRPLEPQKDEHTFVEEETAHKVIKNSEKEEQNFSDKKEAPIVIDKEILSDGVDKTKKYAFSYWEWFKDSIQTPLLSEEKVHNYYGITTLVILSILFSLSVTLPGHAFIGQVDNTMRAINPFNLVFFVKVALVIFIFYAVNIGISYWALRYFSHHYEYSLFEFINILSHRINYTVISTTLIILFAYMGVEPLVAGNPSEFWIMLTLTMVFLSVIGFHIGIMTLFFDPLVELKIDRTFVVLIVEVVSLIVCLAVAKYFVWPNIKDTIELWFNDVTSSASSWIDKLVNSFGN